MISMLTVTALFENRADAGRQLAAAIHHAPGADDVVVGLARGGVPVAVEVARSCSLPVDALAVRKVTHPAQHEYGLGGVTPGRYGIYVRSSDGLTDDELQRAIELARLEAETLDAVLHRDRQPIDPNGKSVILVDDGLATGATMVAAVRWAYDRGAARVVVAIPVAAASSIRLIEKEAEEVVCPHVLQHFGAVGNWYVDFSSVSTEQVVQLLEMQRS